VKNYCLCTACDDGYFPGLMLFLNSLKKFTPDFNGDIVVLDLGLSEKNKAHIDNCIIQKVNNDNYKNVLEFCEYNNGYYTQSFKTIHCHNVSGYDRVVYMDCDLFVNGNIIELFESEYFNEGIWTDKRREFGFEDIYGAGFDRAVMILNKEYTSKEFYNKIINNMNAIINYAKSNVGLWQDLDIEDDACMFDVENVKQLPEKFCRLTDLERITDKLLNKCIIETPLYKWWDNGKKLREQFNKDNTKLETWCDINSILSSKKENDMFVEHIYKLGVNLDEDFKYNV